MKLKPNNGFTLIETLISVILLAITLAGGMALYFNADELLSLVVHKKMATQMAITKMESLRSDGFDNLPPQGSVVDSSISVGGLKNAQQTVTITDIVDSGNILYKKVKVEVSWNEAGGNFPKTVELTTHIAP